LPKHFLPGTYTSYTDLFAEISKFMLVRSIVQCSQEYRKGNYSMCVQ